MAASEHSESREEAQTDRATQVSLFLSYHPTGLTTRRPSSSETSSHRRRSEKKESRPSHRPSSDSDRRRRRDSPSDSHHDSRRSSHRERDRDNDRSERRNSRDRSSRRDSGRDGGRDGGRDRRDSGRERDRDDYRDSKRRRSRSRERNDGGRNRSYDDNRSRQRESPKYDNQREQEPRRPRSPTPPQYTEEEREMRSVFVSQLSARVTDRELGQFFEMQAGKVREAKVITDRISRRSKGVGYVEFIDLDTVQKALALTNTKLLGIPILVQYTEAEKNRQARDGTGQTQGQAAGLYVGSLNFALTESDIRQVFQPFGHVELVDLHKDPVTGKSKGFAFVQFRDPKNAIEAMEKMNNFNLAGREIKVGMVAERAGNMGGGSSTTFSGRHDPSALDDGTGGGNLNQISRIELMQKLSRSDGPLAGIPAAPLFRPNIPQATSRNILLKDAFNPEEETERDWDVELRDDVKGEVESKYGKVAEIFVVKESAGEIYIRFETIDSATQAVTGLNGRWFGGRQIGCSFITDPVFDISKTH